MLIRRLAPKFLSDRRGVSAVEFALIAPVMILLYYGLAELTQAMMAERKASHAASIIGDLVAQDTSVSSSEMTDIFKVGAAMVKPFPTTSLQMRVTSVKADAGGSPKVVWSQAQGMTGLSAGATVAGFPANLIAANESVIMAEVTYTYDSPVHKALPNALIFNEKFYLRPRRADSVLWGG